MTRTVFSSVRKFGIGGGDNDSFRYYVNRNDTGVRARGTDYLDNTWRDFEHCQAVNDMGSQ